MHSKSGLRPDYTCFPELQNTRTHTRTHADAHLHIYINTDTHMNAQTQRKETLAQHRGLLHCEAVDQQTRSLLITKQHAMRKTAHFLFFFPRPILTRVCPARYAKLMEQRTESLPLFFPLTIMLKRNVEKTASYALRLRVTHQNMQSAWPSCKLLKLLDPT